MAFIEIIDYAQSSGALKDIYDQVIATRGKLADVHKVQSLNPPTVLSHMNLYRDIMFGQSPVKRYQREMMAVVVSALNRCEYCKRHHGAALNAYWKDEFKVDLFGKFQWDSLNLSVIDLALCDFARHVTETPAEVSRQQIDRLRDQGLEDRAILDAVLVVAYFNFVNRLVLSLGLQIDDAEIGGYRY